MAMSYFLMGRRRWKVINQLSKGRDTYSHARYLLPTGLIFVVEAAVGLTANICAKLTSGTELTGSLHAH